MQVYYGIAQYCQAPNATQLIPLYSDACCAAASHMDAVLLFQFTNEPIRGVRRRQISCAPDYEYSPAWWWN